MCSSQTVELKIKHFRGVLKLFLSLTTTKQALTSLKYYTLLDIPDVTLDAAEEKLLKKQRVFRTGSSKSQSQYNQQLKEFYK